MKNTKILTVAVLMTLGTTQAAYAQGSAQHFSEAVGHSAQATGHSIVAGAKLASSAVAVPLIVIGGVGQVSQAAGEDLWDIANQPIGAPLPISDETVSVGPAPNIAIKNDVQDEGEGI